MKSRKSRSTRTVGGVVVVVAASLLSSSSAFVAPHSAAVGLTQQESVHGNSRAPFSLPIDDQRRWSSSWSSLSASSNDETTKRNPWDDLWSALASAITTVVGKDAAKETEEERLSRLRRERREYLAEGELRREARVREDSLPYLVLLALQCLPLLGNDRAFSLAYFLGTAVTTVWVGGRQISLAPPERVTRENALYAPIGASVAIGALYALLRFDLFDPTTLYAAAVSLFGALCVSDVAVPILRVSAGPYSTALAETEVEVPRPLAERLSVLENENALPLDGLLALGLGVLLTTIYWSPLAMTQKFVVSNVIAWSLAMVSLGSISLGSFQTASILLAGLFCYDVFWVFGTDVMMTVATKVEAPVKFLYPAGPGSTSAYPFSVLGLGDVVVPGLFVRFLAKADEKLRPERMSYFVTGTAAYAVGLAVCFAVNEITKSGQPALLYLDPACVGTALLTAAANGQTEELWAFEDEDAVDGDDARRLLGGGE